MLLFFTKHIMLPQLVQMDIGSHQDKTRWTHKPRDTSQKHMRECIWIVATSGGRRAKNRGHFLAPKRQPWARLVVISGLQKFQGPFFQTKKNSLTTTQQQQDNTKTSTIIQSLRAFRRAYRRYLFDAIFGEKMDFSEAFIFCIFRLWEYREIVGGVIWSRMHESASKLVSSGRSGKFASIFMFPALPDAICSYSGSAQC